jgi:hypothetical protein
LLRAALLHWRKLGVFLLFQSIVWSLSEAELELLLFCNKLLKLWSSWHNYWSQFWIAVWTSLSIKRWKRARK